MSNNILKDFALWIKWFYLKIGSIAKLSKTTYLLHLYTWCMLDATEIFQDLLLNCSKI